MAGNDKHNELFSRWNFFIKHNWVPAEFEASELHQSWSRCREKCNPFHWKLPVISQGYTLTSRLLKHCDDIALITQHLQPYVEKNQDMAFFIADQDACTLQVIATDDFLFELKELGLDIGMHWDEKLIGTNAITLALQAKKYVQLNQFEHYNQHLHAFTATAVTLKLANSSLVLMLLRRDGSIMGQNQLDDICNNIGAATQTKVTLLNQKQGHNFEHINLNDLSVSAIIFNSENNLIFSNQHAKYHIINDDYIINELKFENALIITPELIKSGQHFIELNIDNVVHRLTISLYELSEGRNIAYITYRQRKQPREINNEHIVLYNAQTESKKMRHANNLLKSVAKTELNILLTGQDGVGKKTIAQSLNILRNGKQAKFVTLNCQTTPQDRIMTELFGAEKEALIESKIEQAYGGTLYIEKIEYLPLSAQSALLKTLFNNLIIRSDGQRQIPVNFQLVTSTSYDLDRMVSENKFKRHLLIKISSVEIYIPSLKERIEDLTSIITECFSRLQAKYAHDSSISNEVMTSLLNYNWPGNFPELTNRLENLIIQAGNGSIKLTDLPSVITQSPHPDDEKMPTLDQIEKAAIENNWRHHKGAINEIAKTLGISRTTLWRKIKRHNIQTNDL